MVNKKVNLRVVGFPVIPDGVRHEAGEEFKAVVTEDIQRFLDSGHLAYNDPAPIEVEPEDVTDPAEEEALLDLEGEAN